MLNPRIQDAFNEQINAELHSAYLYLSMSAYFAAHNLNGMSSWMRIQAQEEVKHAMKFLDFINERAGRVSLAPLQGPKTEWDSPLAAFEAAYGHECMISGRIHRLVELAANEKDLPAHAFLQWFVNEQVEEEASVQQIVERFKLAGDGGVALLVMDGELGKRAAD